MAMTDQEIEAITGGYHGDAFGALGPHVSSGNGKTEWEVRAFLPQAKEVALAIRGKVIPMQRAHKAGLFSARTPFEPDEYKFKITDRHGGAVTEADDVYRFQPILSDFDLHLHSEGTNYEGYHVFRRTPGNDRRRAGDPLRGLGAQRHRRQRSGRLQ